ncbi:MAG TPA: serine hydrolase [Polyangiaceae bacterium]|nr:serine hydrolase [Polyangiaceae bacterium]
MTQRHSILSTSLATTMIIATGLGCGDDPRPVDASIPDRFRAFADRFERERRELEIPGAAVAIVEHGELAFAHGFGTKGIDSDEPVDESTLFRIGSMSKLLTSLGVMSAVDDGLLDLDAPLSEAIPDLSLAGPEADALTLRRLLSQQTGLRDYLVIDGPREDAALAEFASGRELVENVGFSNPPGVFWNYSNPNYYLAGRALEAQAGGVYRDVVRERVLEPLGMDRSYFLPSEALADGDYSHGYGVAALDADAVAPEDLGPDAYDNAWARPAGYAFSNVHDWARLMQFLMAGDSTVISDAAQSEVLSSQVSTRSIYSDLRATALGLADDYGLGIGVGSGFFVDARAEPGLYYDMPFVGHGGDIPGFASTFVVFPSTGFGMVVLSNRDAERPVESMRLAFETFGGLPAPSAPPAGREPDPARFGHYAGRYLDVDGVALEIANEGGALRISGPLLDTQDIPYEAVLEPTSLDNFALWLTYQGERIPLEVTFIDDDAGGVWFRSRIAVARQSPPAATASVP